MADAGTGSGGDAPESTSTSLLHRVKAREPEAWRRLAELYGPLVYGWCRRSGLQSEDAADVVQEVFCTVMARVAEFRRVKEGSGFRSWLRAITRNKIGDHLRRLKRRPQAKGGTDAQAQFQEIPGPWATPSADDPTQEDRVLSHRALVLLRSEFEDRTWQAFWRLAVEGQSPAHVAEDLGITLNAAYKAKSRVLCRLRQELDELQD
jgi:RNA polymerase sigma-70 factor (ECF subfamily)